MTRTTRFATTLLLVLAVLVSLPATTRAAGIELAEQDASAQARALAVRALLNNPATLFFNPAGMAYLDGFDASLGVNLVFPSFSYSDPNGDNPKASTVNKLVPPPHGYFTFATPIHGSGSLGAGIGFNFPYGLTIDWGDDFAGRHLLKRSELLIPEIQVGVAYAPIPQVSFGASFIITPASVVIQKYLGPEFGLVGDDGEPVEDGMVELAGDGVGLTFSAGLQARPTDWLFMGLVYRRGMELEMSGDATFDIPGVRDQSAFPNQTVETAFQLPDSVALGIGAQIDFWYVEADVDYTFWSVFKEIPMTFPEDKTGTLTQTIPEYWEDGFTYRLGNRITVTDDLTLRFGGGYDENPATDEYLSPMLPDADRIFGAVGAGYEFDFGLRLDMSYQFTWFVEREVHGHACTEADAECFDGAGEFQPYKEDGSLNWVGNVFPANYQSHAHLLNITLGYHF